MYKIMQKKTLNNDVELMVIEAPFVAKHAKPGHFIILRVDEDGERIPLTIAGIDGVNITIIYQTVGYSTKLLSEKKIGDTIADFVGPLGQPAHIEKVDYVLGVAGGVGSAPLLPQLIAYKKLGSKVDLVIGGRTSEHLILVDEYKEFCDNIYFATNDGSLGVKGFVTDKIRELLNSGIKYDKAVAIGPVIMMKNVVLLHKEYGLQTDVSLNPIMIDGTGMCGNCRVTVGGEVKFACVDGPDFKGEDIDFDELMSRQKYYHDEEHKCNLGLNHEK